MSIDSEAFAKWTIAFKKRKAYRGIKVELDEGLDKTPVMKTLGAIASDGKFFEPGLLARNLLYACYQAERAWKLKDEHPGEVYDPDKIRRTHFEDGRATIGKNKKAFAAVSDVIEKFPDFIAAALAYPDGPIGYHDRPAKRYKPSLSSLETVKVIAPALRKIVAAYKLSKVNNDTNFSDMTEDCVVGPFLFFHREENRGHSSGPSKDYGRVVEDGLLFHLAYLFRYFSVGSKDPYCSSLLNGEGELVISGTMIKTGKPHVDAVAHLANATFNKKLPTNAISGANVVDRLKVLMAPSVNEKISPASDRRAQPFADLEFYGWPSVT